MGRKEQVKRSAEEKWEILQEGVRSGNIAETCRKHGVAPNLWYRWRDEAEAGAKAAIGGRSAAGGEDGRATEQGWEHGASELWVLGTRPAGNRNERRAARQDRVGCSRVCRRGETVREGKWRETTRLRNSLSS